MRKIKIGDTVTAILFGGKQVKAKITNIEICANGSKTGRPVKNCDLSKHSNGVVDLDDGKERCWCYFDQVKSIYPKE